MQTLQLAALPQLPSGCPVERIEGHIVKVGKYSAGSNAYGPWSFQKCDIRGVDGATAVAKFRDFADLSAWKGHYVQVVQGVNGKGQNAGLAVEDDDYQGKITKLIMISPPARLEQANPPQFAPPSQQAAAAPPATTYHQPPGPPPQQQGPPAYQPPPQAPPPPQQQPPSGPPQPPPGILDDAQKRIAKIAGLYAKCYDAAVMTAIGIFDRLGFALPTGTIGIIGDKIFQETIRRTDPDLLPVNPYDEARGGKAYKGRPLAELMASINRRSAENEAERAHIVGELKEAMLPKSRPAAAPPPPVAGQQYDGSPEQF